MDLSLYKSLWEWYTRHRFRLTKGERAMNAILHVNPKDNLVTCLRDLHQGEQVTLDGVTYTVEQEIPQFHKMAVENIPAGGYAYKYGEVIGRATQDIRVGEHVHVHNLESTRGRGDKVQPKEEV